MSFDLNSLNSLYKKRDIDSLLEVLPDYIEAAIIEFSGSPEGQALIAQHPEIEGLLGMWIDPLLDMGYSYQEVLLPHMTKQDIEIIVTQLFPRKMSVDDPTYLATVIPELIAFWEFLRRAHKHPQAATIVKYLKSIESKFVSMMNDSSKFGIAKSFFSSGTEAGFDMTSQAGLSAFQAQYNASLNLKSAKPQSKKSKGFGELLHEAKTDKAKTTKSSKNVHKTDRKASSPPDFSNLQVVEMDLSMLKHRQEIEPALSLDASSNSQLLSSIASQFGELMRSGSVEEAEAIAASLYEIMDNAEIEGLDITEAERLIDMMEDAIPEMLQEQLSDASIAVLEQQQITLAEPGSILQDFQIFLDTIGEKGIAVTAATKLLPTKVLAEINSKLANPIQTAQKRHSQKSYPNVNGLYLILRSAGIGRLVQQGKQEYLTLNPEILSSWQSLNPTEQYFALLESWLIRASQELMGESFAPLNEGSRFMQAWGNWEAQNKIPSYDAQSRLDYLPGLSNVALAGMFGVIEIVAAKPGTDKGWRIKQINQLPWGEAVMTVIHNAYLEQGMVWDSENHAGEPFGELQEYFQTYFPEWCNNLATMQHEFVQAVYTFKISLGNIWRRIAISSDCSLTELANGIRASVDFDDDHLDQFTYKDQLGRSCLVVNPYLDEDDVPTTDEIRVGDLPIRIGDTIEYLFDFGDRWQFVLLLESIDINDTRTEYGDILEKKGKSPAQYDDYESDNEYDQGEFDIEEYSNDENDDE